MLYTLGDLALEDATFKRQKPLLLLAYLTLEGRKERRYLAELFWPEAAHGLTSLSVALSQIRKVMPEAFSADASHVSSQLDADVIDLLSCLDQQAWAKAVDLYKGKFLEGLQLSLGTELEEWVFQTRDYLAGRIREALLNLAEEAMPKDSGQALTFAEQAYHLDDLSPEHLQRLYRLFVLASSPRTKELEKLASEYDISLDKTEPANQDASARGQKRNHVPALTTALIGRDPELLNVNQLLAQADCRLLTLSGPGGVGKTKLSLHLAHDLLAQNTFEAEVYFIPLDALSSVALLPTVILQSLGFKARTRDPKEELITALQHKACLLILDNFEHLMDAASLLGELLASCSRLKLLVTSREKLNLQEEWVLPLEGLAYPKADEESKEMSLYYGAVQLFIWQARRNMLNFDASTSRHEIFKLCRLVEGSPLGLELAASWVASLPLGDIVSELEHNFDFLMTASRNKPERHKSVRAAFEHSWLLLNPKEQQVLSSLAVFRGGFSREAAAEVAGATLPMLANLVNKSLLRLEEAGRYSRHALLYQYMQEKLADRVDKDSIRARHHQYYLDWLGRQPQEGLKAFDEELENIGLAWHFGLEQQRFAELAEAVFPLMKYFDLRARLKQGIDFFGVKVCSQDADAQRLLARSKLARAFLLTRLGLYTEAKQELAEGLDLCETLKDDAGLDWGLNTSALLARFTGAFEEAKSLYVRMLAREQLSEQVKANVLGSLGVVEEALGNYQAAKTYLLEGLGMDKAQARREALVTKLLNLGTLELNTGQLVQAQQYYQESLTLARQIGVRHSIPILLHNLANIASKQNQHHEAKKLALEALRLVQESGERSKEAGMLSSLAWLSLRSGQLATAQGYARQSLKISYELKDEPSALTALLRHAEIGLELGDSEKSISCLWLISQHPAALGWTRTRAKALLENEQVVEPAAQLPQLQDLLSELVLG
ncbi:MAG: tetratricopeptide repeat protein [Trueperaceae bacterium]|nr:tetratricopeptide repeat protein [Trueperaceae bacterium]